MTKEEIIKGWVISDSYDDRDISLVKDNDKEYDTERELGSLIGNALTKLGYLDESSNEDYENGITKKFIAEDVQMQLFASSTREKLNVIKEKVILDSMGLLDFEEHWYGYSEWTILGFNIETLQLGGHDILNIIRELEGKFVYLIISKAGAANEQN